MTIEYHCYEEEHRYVPSENGGYHCRTCRNWITSVDFEERVDANTKNPMPLVWCGICKAYHVPNCA